MPPVDGGGNGAAVPEPAAIGLLGLALLRYAATRRKSANKKMV